MRQSKKGEQKSLIYDIKEFLKKFFSSRLFILSVVVIAMFGTMIARVFYLQIVNGAYYQKNFTMRIQKPLTIEAARGNIYDSMDGCLHTMSLPMLSFSTIHTEAVPLRAESSMRSLHRSFRQSRTMGNPSRMISASLMMRRRIHSATPYPGQA